MKFLLILFLALAAGSSTYSSDTNTPFRTYLVSDNEPAPLPASKASAITNGITLGQIVSTLGPGWMSRLESAGVITWRFADGRLLRVLPEHYTADDVITTNVSSQSRMWFEGGPTNSLHEIRASLTVNAKEPESIKGFRVVTVTETNGSFALTHLEAIPAPIVLSEPVKDLNHAIRLVGESQNFVPPKRVGRFNDWILFPRLDTAKDDLSFSSGFAVKIGSRVLQKWHGD